MPIQRTGCGLLNWRFVNETTREKSRGAIVTRKSTATAGATIARANRWSFALLGLVRCSRTLRSFGSASALVFVLVVCVIKIGGQGIASRRVAVSIRQHTA